MDIKLKKLLELAINNKASDVHLAEDKKPQIRVNGQLSPVGSWRDGGEKEMIVSLLSEEKKKELFKEKEVDFSFSFGESRLRANVYVALGKLEAALRLIPLTVPSFADLGLPKILESFLNEEQGFVLVTGPTGSGKSTTTAAMLSEINQQRNCHIVTIEDPIEYLIESKKAIVTQRELGRDTNSFPRALRSCLRQDPDVVYVGEMRDLETIGSALTIAETGHLVFSTLHTNSASQTVDRIVDVFDEGSKGQIRLQLASVLTAVVSQRLIPTVDGKRVATFEVMMATPAVRNSIRESKSHMLDNIITTSGDTGMFNLEFSLANLVRQGIVDEKIAMAYTTKPDELQSRLRKNI